MPSYKDEKTGKWYCKFYYEDWNKEKHQKKKSGFKTKREAQAWERDFLEHHTKTSEIIMADLCDKFIENRRMVLKPKSIQSYESTIRLHIKPYIGDIKACDLTPLQIEELHKVLVSKQSVNSTDYVHSVLSSVLNYGIKFYGLKTNPCRIVGRLKHQKSQIRFISINEFNMLLPYFNETYEVLFSLLFWTGIRIGELRALTPKDVSAGEISITKNTVRVKGKDIIQSPKSQNGIRTVELHEKLSKMLLEYCNRIYDKDGPIFPMSSQAIRCMLNNACVKAGLPHMRIHDMRHPYVKPTTKKFITFFAVFRAAS